MLKNNLPTLGSPDVLPGTRVLVRADFNVPVVKGEVFDSFRIKRSLKTINFLRDQGAKVILVSHITSSDTLEPVSKFLDKLVPHIFVEDFNSEQGEQQLSTLKEGEVALLENLRRNEGEAANHIEFSRALASLADVYVNDAFSVSHRKHASVVGVPQFLPSFAGFLLAEEVANLERALDPDKPLVFVLGGAKFETKIPLVEKFLKIADTIVVGGALANDVYRSQGLEVGVSLVSDVDITNIAVNEKVSAPAEVVILRGGERVEVSIDQIQSEDLISDASPRWVEGLEEKIRSAKTILWNGPLGNYEAGFSEASTALARMIAEAKGFSIVGGGDTVALIESLGISEGFDFISTGGGAMLDFLSSGTLPGIKALENRR